MQSSIQLPVMKVTGDQAEAGPDALAIEEPLEIRLVYGPANARISQNLAVTMRTPGHDADLAMGFLFTEGIISGPSAVEDIRHLSIPCSENKQNTIQVSLNAGYQPKLDKADRNFYTTSSCGVCGKASIDAIRTVSAAGLSAISSEDDSDPPLDPTVLEALPQKLRSIQPIFEDTGGLHAAALFNNKGEPVLVREDVGRHNALDKLIGAALTCSSNLFDRSIVLLSGRASFELIQKAAMARIPIVAAVGAPSSLAVSLAEEFGITLIGFLRASRFNIYSATHRIQLPKSHYPDPLLNKSV
jgi:FdhD protein